MISLIEILKELGQRKHYTERKIQRTNISRIKIPDEAYGDYDVKETNNKLISILKKEILDRLNNLEKINIVSSFKYYVGYRVFKPILISNGKRYPIIMYVEYQERNKAKTKYGDLYYVVVNKDELITLILSSDISNTELEHRIAHNLEIEQEIRNANVKIIESSNYDYVIDLDKLYGKSQQVNKIPSKDSVEYKVNMAYRKGTSFNHKTYGEGIVVNTSNGTAGMGDARGKLDWVDVDFKNSKPVLKGGKLTTIKRISPVYTKKYFDNL